MCGCHDQAQLPDIEQLLSDIFQNLNILYPSWNSLQVFQQLFRQLSPRGNRVFDVEIASIMMASSIQEIATINAVDFSHIKGIRLFVF